MTKIAKNWLVRNFLTKLKFFIFSDFFTKDVLTSLLWGAKTIRKKYQDVFEKFANLCSKNRKKNQPPILAKIFEKSNFLKIFWVFRKKYLDPHSKRIRNRFEKIVSSLRDISLKKKVYRPSFLPSHPSIPSVTLKNFENQKRSILEGVFEIKKKVV